MEENLRPGTPPVNPDLAAEGGCMDELTRPNSESLSSVENSKDTSRYNANAGQVILVISFLCDLFFFIWLFIYV